MTKYSNEDIIESLRNLSDQLGRKNLSTKDVQSVIPVSTVNNRFGNLGNALDAAGLERTDSTAHFKDNAPQLTDNDLFTALYQVEIEVGREPGPQLPRQPLTFEGKDHVLLEVIYKDGVSPRTPSIETSPKPHLSGKDGHLRKVFARCR